MVGGIVLAAVLGCAALSLAGMFGAAKVGSVGPDGFGEKAQGEFCLVSVQVKNVGKSAEVFNDFSQKAYAADGTEFSADSGAATWVNKDSSTFLESINPGNTVKGKVVFDVPKGGVHGRREGATSLVGEALEGAAGREQAALRLQVDRRAE